MPTRKRGIVHTLFSFMLCAYVTLSPIAPSAFAGNYDFSQFPAHPSAAQASNPRTSFQTDEFTGSFGYQIPIELPPARPGATPSLALSYGSSGSNGWVGVGWSLDVGHIERDGRQGVPIKWATSGSPLLPVSPLQYDDAKGFVFSFQGESSRLALVNAGTGEYRPEIDKQGLKFILSTTGWTVYAKNGAIYKFGLTADSANSRMDIPVSETSATGNAKTFRWALSSSQDTNGNRVVYEYSAPVTPSNQIYLSKIQYNGHTSQALPYSHTVEFAVEDRKDSANLERDVPLSFRSGYKVETKKRLKTITTKVSGVRARQYELVYTQSPSSGRSMVSQVKEYGKTGATTAHPPILLTYQLASLSFAAPITWGSPGGVLLHQTGVTPPTSGTRPWNAIGFKTSGAGNSLGGRSLLDLMDIDRDGLPDRVLADLIYDVGAGNDPPNMYLVQHNTAQNTLTLGFDSVLDSYSFAAWLNAGGPAAMRGSLGWNGTSQNITDNGYTYLKLIDINGDGYTDRVHDWRRSTATTTVQKLNFYVEYGGPTGYGTLTACGPIQNHTSNSDVLYVTMAWDTPEYAMQDCDMSGGQICGTSFPPINSVGALVATLLDVNGDGLPDRLLRLGNDSLATRDHFLVQMNILNALGEATFGPLQKWKFDNQYVVDQYYWNNPFTFESGTSANSNTSVGMFDVNGDGLPDRLMRKSGSCTGNPVSYFDNFVVQYNKGYGFEDGQPPSYFGPLEMPAGVSGFGSCSYANPSSSEDTGISGGNQGSFTIAMLQDVNGDGLVDRIVHDVVPNGGGGWVPAMWVQMNEGSRFGAAQPFGNLQVLGNACNTQFPGPWHYPQASMPNPWPCETLLFEPGNVETVSYRDINGDGLPDRVMANPSFSGNAGLRVQLATGDVPDLLERVENGIGGKITVEYKPSTNWVNRDIDVPVGQTPWQANAKGLLASVINTAWKVTVEDGIHAAATTEYTYFGGMYDYTDKEFRGFHKTTKKDPTNAYTVTWFHQDGGMDHSSLGEYRDVFNNVPSSSKRGMPFRIESYDAQDRLFQLVINKVDEAQLTAGVKRWFPFIAQTTTQNYETLATPRSTVEIFEFFTTGTFATNFKKQTSVGEVTGFNASTHAYTNVLSTDDFVHEFTYTTVTGNAEIRDRVDFEYFRNSVLTILRQTDSDYYATNGNLLTKKSWRDLPSVAWLTESFTYDIYGNVENDTRPAPGTLLNPTGAGEIVTRRTLWDGTYHAFPAQVIEDYGTGTFNYTTVNVYDQLSGQTLTSTDWNGLVTRNVYDNFHRVSEIWLDIPSSPSLWQQTYDYQFNGVSGGVSANRIHRVVNDASDPAGQLGVGHEAYTYSDGFGRVVQSRVESERIDGSGQPLFRVADTRFDVRGSVSKVTREHFSANSAFTAILPSDPFTLTEYDAIGRAIKLTPPVGDANSPTGYQTTDYLYSTNPWARVIKDGKKTSTGTGSERREYRNAFGRIEKVEEVVSVATVYSTTYKYDAFGDLTEVLDHKLNKTTYTYDSLGRKLSTNDPDLGVIATSYFDDGSVKSETDAAGQRTDHLYDHLGRISDTKTYAAGSGTPDEAFSYLYDNNTDGTAATFPVYKGQLFKVIDAQGFTRNGYDIRGHILRTLRNVTQNSNTSYTTQYTYDDAGRLATLIYPRGLASLKYTYDNAGNLQRIEATSGTGPVNEVFYDAQQFDELRQPEVVRYGNQVLNTYTYYPGSKRLQTIRAQLGTNPDYQNLTYTYDAASNVLSIADNVLLHAGLSSSMRSSIQYDTLYRLTSYQRPIATGMQTVNLTYDEIGNMLTNADNTGSGSYLYPTSGPNSVRPHAVSSTSNSSFVYDTAGNMTTRGPAGAQQTLGYNARNLLTSVTPPTGSVVTSGYDAAGKRLWKQAGTALTVWIGQHYEVRGNKQLCHVIADGKRICTFQPITSPMPAQAVLIPQPGQNAVFDYYHQDQLHSSNIITDRSGAVVQEYEYAAFGAELYVASATEYALLNRFTDQVWDVETGLYYYGHRFYDPALGRFIQADNSSPDVYNPQGLNRYTYVLNNPFRYVDPTGSSWWDSIKNVVKGAVLGDFAGEDLGIAGMIGQIAVGFSPLGVLADVRDFAAAAVKVVKGEGSLGDLALAGAGLIPGVSEGRKLVAGLGIASEIGQQVLKHTDEVAEVATKVARRADDISAAAKASGRLGREGEAIASEITGAAKNTESFVVNGRKRIPDQVLAQDIATRNPTHIVEAKNVKSQSLTEQLRDSRDLVGGVGSGGRVDVALPPGAKVSGPLQRAFDDPTNPLNRIDLVRPQP